MKSPFSFLGPSSAHRSYLQLAASLAEEIVGATAPNPPVGAVIVSSDPSLGGESRVIGMGVHEGAGKPHAEVVALENAKSAGFGPLLAGATIYVTLEPCQHYGRTPPCTKAILEAGIGCVVFGETDPNLAVLKSGVESGAGQLRAQGIEVIQSPRIPQLYELVAAFRVKQQTGGPRIVHKLAYRLNAFGQLDMLPDSGKKTFTEPQSLYMAHQWRRQCDAIITGMGTVLADSPQFNVRHVPELTVVKNGEKVRPIYVVGRDEFSSKDVQEKWNHWVLAQTTRQTPVHLMPTLEDALFHVRETSALQVLLEAGPKLSAVAISKKLWHKRVNFIHFDANSQANSQAEQCHRRDLYWEEDLCLQES